MVCLNCGGDISELSEYYSVCGARQRRRITYQRLTLSATDSKIAGVCGGIAEYLDVDPTIVRLIRAALSVVPGGLVGGVLAASGGLHASLEACSVKVQSAPQAHGN